MDQIRFRKRKPYKTLEERDREDRDLFGWKGGMTSYARELDLDSYDTAEGKEE